MLRPFLTGPRLYLRRLEESDLTEIYLGWLNDPLVTRYLETGRYPASTAEVRAFWQRFENNPSDLLFAIVLRAGDRHIGNVTLNHIHPVHRTADTGLMLGARDCWGRGYAGETWSLLIEYAFQRLSLRKIIAGVVADNTASLRTLRKLGFVVEGTLREEFFLNGRFCDTLRLGLFPAEFHPLGAPGAAESSAGEER